MLYFSGKYKIQEEIGNADRTCCYVCRRSGKDKRFFIKYFDAKAGERYYNPQTEFQSYFLSFDGGARLEIMQKPRVSNLRKELARIGLIHVAFSVGSREKVDELTKRLQEDGYKVISGPRVTGDGYYESCIFDVEDNQIEITI